MVRGTTAGPDGGHWARHSNGNGRLQDVPVLGHHEHGDEVDDGEGQELGLLGLLLQGKALDIYFSVKLKRQCLDERSHHVSVNYCPQPVHVHVLEQLLGVLHRAGVVG